MMEVKAIHRGARISAQKTRLVADQIRGLPISRAMNILNFSPKKAAFIMKKVVESAIANAEHNKGADIDELKVSAVIVDKATSLSVLLLAPKAAVTVLRNKVVTLA